MTSFKNPYINMDLVPSWPKSLKATILYNKSKHNMLALVAKANKCKLADFISVPLGF